MDLCDFPLKFDEINLNNIVYNKIKSNKNKTVIFLKYKNKNNLSNFVIQSPALFSNNKLVKGTKCSYLDVPLLGKKKEKVNDFINFLEKLDEKVIYDAKLNSNSWFKEYDIDDNVNFQRLIRISENKNTKGELRLKIINNSEFKTVLKLNNKKIINEDEIPENQFCKIILEMQAVWVNKNGFGIFFRPILISFYPVINKKIQYQLIESEEEIDDIIDSEESNDTIFEKNNSESTCDLNIETSNFSSSTSSEEINYE